ncbi:hypothetical protein Q7P37_003399 [Cladosporium fusiforme]
MPEPRDSSSEGIGLYDRPLSRNSDEGVEQAKLNLSQHPQLDRKRSWVKTFLFQTACFLWILPVVALLTLNIKKHIVGASAWCPDQNCYVGWFNPVISIPQGNLRHFDKRDHNLLGALQFAAKAVEIWFELIALALVYLITFRIAGKKDGLPIGFLMRPCEFADLPGLFDPLMWKTLPPLSGSKNRGGSKRFRTRIYLFVAFTVLLCVLCNLMGPAIAVLALPSLQWIDTPKVGDTAFGSINSGTPPTSNDQLGYFWNATTYCTEEHFANQSYSCASDPYAMLLDSWMEVYLAAGIYADGLTQEQYVKFKLNQTFITSSENVIDQEYSDITWWVPSRQLMSDLSNDFQWVGLISMGINNTLEKTVYTGSAGTLDPPEEYYTYNRSLLLNLQRNGPILGAIIQSHRDPNNTLSSVSEVDDDRSIRCYENYDLSMSMTDASNASYTKCIRTGSGWGPRNKQAGFTVLGEQDYTTNTLGPDVEVSIFSSDKARFLEDGKLPDGIPPGCLQVGQVSSTLNCDWDRLFEEDANSNLYNRTQNITTIEMSIRSNNSDEATFKLTVDFVAFLNFTTYSLDPSPLTNPTTLVQTQTLPQGGISIDIDPAWMLAAWTVDRNGTMAPNRSAAINVVRTLDRLRLNDTVGLEGQLGYVTLLPVIQALSLVDYTTEFHGATDAARPRLWRNAHMYVWAYGLESRTSKLGVVVAFLGVAVVLVQVVLGVVDRRKYRSPTQLLVAALEHAPSGEFKDVEHDEVKVASMRFRVHGTRGTAGKYLFHKHDFGS